MKYRSIVLALTIILSVPLFAQAESYSDFNRRFGASDWSVPSHIFGGALVGGLTHYYLPDN